MRRMIVACVFGIGLVGSAQASPALTIAPSEMRDAPNPYAHVVQSIPANAEIKVRNCGEVWCSASWRDIHGFVLASVISAGPEAPPDVYRGAPPPAVVVAPPVVIAPFGWGYAYGWGHPWRHYY